MRATILTLLASLLISSTPTSGAALTAIPTRWIESPPGAIGFGRSVDAGDLDRDGVPDFVVGSNPTAVFSGRTGQLILLIPGVEATFGIEVDVLGDVDLDQVPDLLIAGSFGGRAGVFSGSSGSILLQGRQFGYEIGLDAGQSMSVLNDVTGDGRADFAIGRASFDMGLRTDVYSGADGWLHGAVPRGHSVTSLGDVDGDGFGDFACGRHFGVTVYSGRSLQSLYDVPGMDAVLGAADVDGDGVKDLLLQSGTSVIAFSGLDGDSLLAVTVATVTPGFFRGMPVGMGDLDGDGNEDFAASAMTIVNGIPGPGTVSIFSGATGDRLARIDGPEPQALFGWSLVGPGDVDGDGIPDLLVGAPGVTARSGGSPGAVMLYRFVEGEAATTIDILPGDCPNRIHERAGNPVEVAIHGSSSFDVRTIEHASVRLAGSPPSRRRSRVRDVGAPSGSCTCASTQPDGWDDRIFVFDAADVRAALAGSLDGQLTLTARASDGRLVAGTDCAVIDEHVATIELERSADLEPARWSIMPTPARRGVSVELRLISDGPPLPGRIRIHDASGRRVREFEASTTVLWDGRDDRGSVVSAGLYFVRGNAAGVVGRILLLP